MADLVETLNQKGIQPIGKSTSLPRFTEYRELDATNESVAEVIDADTPDGSDETDNTRDAALTGIGDCLTIVFDDKPNRIYQLKLIEGKSDLLNGEVAIESSLGQQLVNAADDDEFNVDWGGCLRKCTVRSIQRSHQLA